MQGEGLEGAHGAHPGLGLLTALLRPHPRPIAAGAFGHPPSVPSNATAFMKASVSPLWDRQAVLPSARPLMTSRRLPSLTSCVR